MRRLILAVVTCSTVCAAAGVAVWPSAARAQVQCPGGQELDPVGQVCKTINDTLSPPPQPGGGGGNHNHPKAAGSSGGSSTGSASTTTYASGVSGSSAFEYTAPSRPRHPKPKTSTKLPALPGASLRYASERRTYGGGPAVGTPSPAVLERASRVPFAGAIRALGQVWLLVLFALIGLALFGYVRLKRRPERFKTLAEAFHLFRPALAGQRWGLIQALTLTLAVIGLELLRPWPIKFVIDRVLRPQGRAWGLDASATIVFAAAATVVISVLLGVLSVHAVSAAARTGKRITVRIRRQVFEHLHRLAVPFHEESRTGDLLYRLMGDVNDIRDVLFESWLNVISKALLVVGTAIAMLFVDVRIALIALLPLPLLGIEVTRLSRTLRSQLGDQFRHEARAASLAGETLRHISLVKAYVAERRLTKSYAKESRRGERVGVSAAMTSARMNLTIELLTGLGLAAVILFGAFEVLSGRLSPGTLVVLATYSRSLYKPLRKAPNEGEDLSKALASTKRLVEVLRVSPEGYGVGQPAPRFRGELTLRRVRFSYRDGVEALHDVNLEVPAGALVLLQGPNGSGKSTLLSVLLRLLEPDTGDVLVDGKPVDRYELQSYRQRFAYVPQQVQLFGATVRENIAYGRPDATDREIEEATRIALFDEVARRLPGDLEQALGEGGATLSGGEARRLMLARAALRDARVVLLDEPLAGLDPSARQTVSQAIRALAAGRTTIVVSHGEASEVEPDVVVRMRSGKIVDVEWSTTTRVGLRESGGEVGAAASSP